MPAPKQLKVWGWQSFRLEARVDGNHSGQTREIVAAASKAEVARIANTTVARMFNLCETGNTTELEVALANPRVVYWTPLNIHRAPYLPSEH